MDGLNSRMEETKNKSMNLKIDQQKVPNLNQQGEKIKKKKKEYSVLINLWDYNKGSNISVIRVPEEEEKRAVLKKHFRKYWLKTSQIW